MAEIPYIPRFLKVGSADYKKTIDYLNQEYDGQTVIVIYQVIDPSDQRTMPDAAKPVFAAKRWVVTDQQPHGKTYNLGFFAPHVKGTPQDPNDL